METSRPHLDRLRAGDHAGVSDKGRTAVFASPGRSARAFVLLHGLSASPAQFDRFARELHARGHNVLVPRLPRHGHRDRMSTALDGLQPARLFAAIDTYVAAGRELGESVTVAGFSLGGLLTAWIAQRHEVDRCVAIAPFLGIAYVPRALMPLLSEVLLRMPNRFPWWNPFLRERQMPEHGYPRFATHSIAHADRMARVLLLDARSRGPSARRTVLVINDRESGVNNRTVQTLYTRWSQRRPEAVEMVAIAGLPPSHDIIEPLRGDGRAAELAFPRLLAAIDPE